MRNFKEQPDGINFIDSDKKEHTLIIYRDKDLVS